MNIAKGIGCLIGIIIMSFAGCGDEALFDELGGNRLTVILKGTYESNDPRPWTGAISADDSIDDCPGTEDVPPTKMMLDIAEMRVAQGKHYQKFANYRRTYTFPLTNDEPFFNGDGAEYRNDDVRPHFHWQTLKVYTRKMIFDGANQYQLEDDGDAFNGAGTWVFNDEVSEIFEEESVQGYDVNRVQLLTYYDNLREYSSSINRIFPIKIPIIDDLVFDDEDEKTILEVRIVVKNFLKKYELDAYGDYHYAYHLYGFSDWLRDVNRDETAIGGNIIAVARSYVPGKTVTISGNCPVGKYIIAFSDTYTVSDFIVGDRTRPTCDEPKLTSYLVPGDLESLLDYYLMYESHKVNFNSFVACVDDGTYADEWEAYDDRLRVFMIPPLATWSSGGTYQLTNVPVGKTYHLYYADDPGSPSLPTTFLGHQVITVTSDMAGQTVNRDL